MIQKQLYGIAVFEEEIVLSDFTDSAEKRFTVSPEQLMDFFRSEVTFRPFPGLVWMKSDGNGETYLITLPAAQRTILYRRQKGKGKDTLQEVRLRFPAIAIRAQIDVIERRVSAIDLWGFAGRTLRSGTVLYELPLPNLSGSRLCLGSTERAMAGDVRGAVERTVFDTPFNHHSLIVGVEKLPFHDYIAKHGGRCPLRTLRQLGKGGDIL